MTKKHFIMLADAIRRANYKAEPFSETQIETLCDFCYEMNSNFNRGRFIGYIKRENGPSGGRVK